MITACAATFVPVVGKAPPAGPFSRRRGLGGGFRPASCGLVCPGSQECPAADPCGRDRGRHPRRRRGKIVRRRGGGRIRSAVSILSRTLSPLVVRRLDRAASARHAGPLGLAWLCPCSLRPLSVLVVGRVTRYRGLVSARCRARPLRGPWWVRSVGCRGGLRPFRSACGARRLGRLAPGARVATAPCRRRGRR